MEKNVEKQLIVRTYEPDMNQLKQTARQLARMQDVSLNLYGNAGEVLIAVTARAYAHAAATELTESVAEQFELALGPAVYGRGKGSLAYFTAGELIQNESNIAAADHATGILLSEEFSHTKRGSAVYDFGEESYHNVRVEGKIQNAVYKYADEGDAAQTVAARAAAAAKYGHADYGVAVAGVGSGETVWAAVAHRGYVYLRRFQDQENIGKTVALAVLDTVRRLEKKQPVERARAFKANSDFDWNQPVKKRQGNPYLAPILVLALLLAALGVACWYFFTHFSLGGQAGSALPVGDDTSVSTPAPAQPAPPVQSVTPPDAGTPADSTPPDGAQDGASSDAGAPADSTPGAGTQSGGIVHPFG